MCCSWIVFLMYSFLARSYLVIPFYIFYVSFYVLSYSFIQDFCMQFICSLSNRDNHSAIFAPGRLNPFLCIGIIKLCHTSFITHQFNQHHRFLSNSSAIALLPVFLQLVFAVILLYVHSPLIFPQLCPQIFVSSTPLSCPAL